MLVSFSESESFYISMVSISVQHSPGSRYNIVDYSPLMLIHMLIAV
jgi:hypothetical protein